MAIGRSNSAARGLGPRAAKPRGFTLIEIIVVVALIGILATLVALAVGDGGRRESLRNAADTVRWLAALAAQEAVLTSRPTALVFADRNAEDGGETTFFLQEYRDRRWQTRIGDPLFKPRLLPAGVVAWVSRPSETRATGAPSAIFFPDGSDERLRLELRDAYGTARIALIPDGGDYLVVPQ